MSFYDFLGGFTPRLRATTHWARSRGYTTPTRGGHEGPYGDPGGRRGGPEEGRSVVGAGE